MSLFLFLWFVISLVLGPFVGRCIAFGNGSNE